VKPHIPILLLLLTCALSLLSVRLLNNLIVRFMDYWMPKADRRIPRAVVRIYRVSVFASVTFILVGAMLVQLGVKIPESVALRLGWVETSH
jgi:hypothetical protein